MKQIQASLTIDVNRYELLDMLNHLLRVHGYMTELWERNATYWHDEEWVEMMEKLLDDFNAAHHRYVTLIHDTIHGKGGIQP